MLKNQYVGQYFQKELQSINAKSHYRKISVPQIYPGFEKKIIIDTGTFDTNSKEYIEAQNKFSSNGAYDFLGANSPTYHQSLNQPYLLHRKIQKHSMNNFMSDPINQVPKEYFKTRQKLAVYHTNNPSLDLGSVKNSIPTSPFGSQTNTIRNEELIKMDDSGIFTSNMEKKRPNTQGFSSRMHRKFNALNTKANFSRVGHKRNIFQKGNMSFSQQVKPHLFQTTAKLQQTQVNNLSNSRGSSTAKSIIKSQKGITPVKVKVTEEQSFEEDEDEIFQQHTPISPICNQSFSIPSAKEQMQKQIDLQKSEIIKRNQPIIKVDNDNDEVESTNNQPNQPLTKMITKLGEQLNIKVKKEQTEQQISKMYQDSVKQKKMKAIARKLGKEDSRSCRSKEKFEFDLVSVKKQPPLIQEFIEQTNKEDKEKREKQLKDLVDEIRIKKNKNFVTYINDFGSQKFQGGASQIIPPSKRLQVENNFIDGNSSFQGTFSHHQDAFQSSNMYVADQSSLSVGKKSSLRQDRIYLSPRQLNINRQQVSKKYYNQLNNPYLRNERRINNMISTIEEKNKQSAQNNPELTQVSFGDEGQEQDHSWYLNNQQ